MKADRKRLKGEKTDLVSQMQQLYATLESREEQLRDFIRNYEQHRKVSTQPPPLPLPQPPAPSLLPLPHPAQGLALNLKTQMHCSCPLMLTWGGPLSGPGLGAEMNRHSP